VVKIRLVYRPESVSLLISDDGRGMDAETLESGRPGHFGLSGMRERAERIGAEFSLASTPGRGTSVAVKVSYVQRQRFRAGLAILRGWLNSRWPARSKPSSSEE
jgi:nitrate/nitrite-specific signal transduction histidine kinase